MNYCIKFSHLIVGCLLATFVAQAQVQRPRLVVGIVVDQMRWDYLDFYSNEFAQGGFSRLLSEGFSFDNTQIDYMPTVTACGHSCIYSGSVPSLTGIAGNYFYIDGKRVYCTADSTEHTVGSSTKQGQHSPRNLRVSTLCDALKRAQRYQSRTVSISLKDRGAILPGGHTADAAYWYDSQAGHFVSSTYYTEQLPEWVERFNQRYQVAAQEASEVRYTPQGNELVAQLAIAALRNEKLGQLSTSDFLAVSFSSTDYVGHRYGTMAEQTAEVYRLLDRKLAQLLDALDQEVGRGNYLVFLTADHAAADNHLERLSRRLPAGIFKTAEVRKALNEYLKQRFSVASSLVTELLDYRLYLDHAVIVREGLDVAQVKAAAIEWLQTDDRVLYAGDFAQIGQAPLPQSLRERIIRGYNSKRSGDIQFLLQPGFYLYDDESYERGTDHGSPYAYDSHIPFLLYGWNIPYGKTNQLLSITDIVPTICSLLTIQVPDGCIGRPYQF